MDKFLIWGTGADALKYGTYWSKMEQNGVGEIVGFVDKDIRKRGQRFLGKVIYMPDEIASLDFVYLDIWSSKYYKEIYSEAVDRYHISPEKIKDFFFPYKQKLKERYEGTNNREIKEFVEAMHSQPGIDVFYYEPAEKKEIWNEVFFDEGAQMHYLFFEGKRMYLKKGFPFTVEKNGKKYIGNMYAEQDVNSPHRYESDDIAVEPGDILIDAGACEGNFSLHNIDKVKKVYLVECDQDWIEALHYTFEPYKDKVVFCQKFLSDKDSEETIRLDTLAGESVNFIKMDIEGEEIRALKGGRRLLTESEGLKCAVCSYHRHGDEEKIRELLENMGFETVASNGYMLFMGDDDVIKNPELRHGVIRGRKRCL